MTLDREFPAETDEQLLARLKSGDQDAIATLISRYEREMYGYLRRYVGDAELAADVFQNTFVQVYLKIDHYEVGRPVRPWLYTIATHQAIDALRRQARRADIKAERSTFENDGHDRQQTVSELIADPAAGPLKQAENLETRQMVRATVDLLPEGLRQVVILTYFQGLRYQEVAEIMNIPLGTVKSRLHAALQRLAESWPHPTDE